MRPNVGLDLSTGRVHVNYVMMTSCTYISSFETLAWLSWEGKSGPGPGAILSDGRSVPGDGKDETQIPPVPPCGDFLSRIGYVPHVGWMGV